MENLEKIENIVRSVLADRFDDVVIHSIDVKPDFDEDGDRILYVEVVFDGVKRSLPAKTTSGLVRSLLPKMEAIGEDRFPVFSFIAKSEIGKANTGSV